MRFKVGIDVGGTFTDFFLVGDGMESIIHKVLSTPADPSIAVTQGLEELAQALPTPLSLKDFLSAIEVIVHGTTVTTNATLTRRGAKSALLTTQGVRDALEMRRGIREEQYNNRYTNVVPLVPRYLRIGVEGRLDRKGREITPLNLKEIKEAIALFKKENVTAVSICFMNSFANPAHERAAAQLVRQEMPDAYLTVSTDLLSCIRFYERVSTTALNTYVGPLLDHYLSQLQMRLKNAGFHGVLLIMQSNGGVMSPDVARKNAALTLLSGPAGGPGAGRAYAATHGLNNCIVVDMGGTSFEAALVVDSPVMVNEGEIDRLRIALPMLGIHTIGAGGGSIGWIDEGGLLRMGPQSAGASPGPVCYRKGGKLPTTTDANLVLGYLNPDYFAGGRINLDMEGARRAIEEHIAKPLGLSIEEAAAGMYRIICTNMAQGVREITIKRGSDPREFPMVVAGGAGPLHSCLICTELEIPLQIVPRESSVLCAVGMLMGDLKHDFVRTFISRLKEMNWSALSQVIASMKKEGEGLLIQEGIPSTRHQHFIKFDCRYTKQYHEVSVVVPEAFITAKDVEAITKLFHDEHNRLYGYSLEGDPGSQVEIINVRVQSVGITEKPQRRAETYAGPDPSSALKGERSVYVFEEKKSRPVPIYDGAKLKYGNRIIGPAMIEMETTAVFVSADYDCVADRFGSLAMYKKGREDLVADTLAGDKA